ncbi:uncharacterized protein LOC132544205 [Ylistrum balloti]|uniref:uncharacterized protein LOC132544205 n=1 Tax=Ylistrum balloti TaxID=509963 RepID=UPI002905C01F|nr:uncharacterized protein LOC132544205 [Ylistrum balloti]
MAEAVNEVNSAKISCYSRNSALKITDCVQTNIANTISEHAALSGCQKNTTRTRFNEVFDSAFKLNIEGGGQNWADAENDEDCTTENEPLDVSKKVFITDTLSTKLDDAVVKAAQNRKTTGKRFKYKMKKLITAETEYLSQICVMTDDSEPSKGASCLYDNVTCDRLLEGDTILSNLTKTTTTLIQQFSNLERAVEISGSSNACKTDQVIFNPTSDEGKMAESITPLKRKLRGGDNMSIAKRRNSQLGHALSPLKSLNHTPNRSVTLTKRCSPRLAARTTDQRTRLKHKVVKDG